MTKAAPVLVIAGPTASGKTAAALALAQHLPIEIISMDSALVYRGMDIGTAKPSPAERASVPHHLIDIIEPTESYSAARFALDASRCIEEIRARGATPVLVGGTMLYLKALSEGLDAMPGADLAVRAALDVEAMERGWPALHAELLALDPTTAERLNPNDAQRISRALEVLRSTGVPLSAYHGRQSSGGIAIKLLSLEPQDRSILHERINSRFVAMLHAGLLQEVAQLRQLEGINANLPSMRCVGYRQAWEHQDGLYDVDELIARGQAASRQLAKRQLTWLRGMPGRVVIACDDLGSVADQVIDKVLI